MINIDDVVVPNKLKKRGRPKKNAISSSKQKSTNNKLIEEDVIIHFPISLAEVQNGSANGFELTNAKCANDEQPETDLTDDEEYCISDKSPQQLMKIIEEKNNIISELETKLSESNISIDTPSRTSPKIKMYLLNSPYEHANDGTLIVPEHTKNACLWDTCEINATPCFLPDKYYDGKFYVVGWFCSLNCAVAYNLSLDDYRVSERYSLLKMLYGKTQDVIEPSPSCRILDKFGGNISIDTYRKNLKKCDKEYRLLMPPMTCVRQTLEERISLTAKQNTNKSSIIDTMRNRNKTRSLKKQSLSDTINK